MYCLWPWMTMTRSSVNPGNQKQAFIHLYQCKAVSTPRLSLLKSYLDSVGCDFYGILSWVRIGVPPPLEPSSFSTKLNWASWVLPCWLQSLHFPLVLQLGMAYLSVTCTFFELCEWSTTWKYSSHPVNQTQVFIRLFLGKAVSTSRLSSLWELDLICKFWGTPRNCNQLGFVSPKVISWGCHEPNLVSFALWSQPACGWHN